MLAPIETTPKYQTWTDSQPTYSEKPIESHRDRVQTRAVSLFLYHFQQDTITFNPTPPLSDTTPVETPPTFDDIQSWVSYRNPEAVEDFLTKHQEVKNALYEAAPLLQKIFGASVRVVLEVLSYPEEGSYDELVGWIQSTDDVITGLEKLEQFEDVWLPEHLDLSINTFNFNLETI